MAVETDVEWIIVEQEGNFHDGSALLSVELSLSNLKKHNVI